MTEITQTVKVIVKIEKDPRGKVKPLLFFPETPANRGRIECWDGNHCEATMGYFWSLKNPPQGLEADVTSMLQWYERQYQCAGPFKLQRVQRDSGKMRNARWSY